MGDERPRSVFCYVDESIQRSLGYVATAFVVAPEPLEPAVAEVLRGAGLVPGRDEFKSGARMAERPDLQELRDRLLGLAGDRARLAAVFSPVHRRDALGRYALQALQSVLVRNSVPREELTVFFDSGIFPSESAARELRPLFGALSGATLYAREDSKLRLGIQVADAVAHTFGQVLRAAVTGDHKAVHIGPTDDDWVPLSAILLSRIRHAVFRRPIVFQSVQYDTATDPIVATSEDELLELGINAEALGWGVQVAADLSNDLSASVRLALERLWLGCYH